MQTRKFIWNLIFFFISIDAASKCINASTNKSWYLWLLAAFCVYCAFYFGKKIQETTEEPEEEEPTKENIMETKEQFKVSKGENGFKGKGIYPVHIWPLVITGILAIGISLLLAKYLLA